jgi:protein tyrosine phosphatase (PTP) superfamily phosphohydrolase (DUF442 family)
VLAGIQCFAQLTPMLATSGQPTAIELRQVLGAGYTVVINLGLNDPTYALPDEQEIVRSANAAYVHIPVEFGAPEAEQLKAFSAAMGRAEGQKIFVHCRHNKRVPVFVALDRILRLGWSRERALDEMNAVWKPDPNWIRFIEKELGEGVA